MSKRGEAPDVNLYSILGCDIKASKDNIRRCYLKLARKWHPDRHGGSDEAKRKFQEIAAAFEILSNDERRQQYDLGLLDLLDVEEYLQRYQGLILTVCGLGLGSSGSSGVNSEATHQRIRRARSNGFLLAA